MSTDLDSAPEDVIWGHEAVYQALKTFGGADLLYFYCHGSHNHMARRAGSISGFSSLSFSTGQELRLVDLERICPQPYQHPPLVFLNACEGATRDAFEYDGFMRFFIERKRARGFIGAEIKVPPLLAHHFAIDFLRAFVHGEPIGKTLWQLRRSYLDNYHNILAFAYTLYGLGDIRVAYPRA